MKISTIVRMALATCALAFSAQASAAPVLQINSSGILTGAKGVEVLGKSYDVTFADGTCNDLFTGCDAASDFTFSSQVEARAAGEALLAQVFVDVGLYQFDSVTDKIFGCTSGNFCNTLIPYLPIATAIGNFYHSFVRNYSTVGAFSTSADVVQFSNMQRTTATSASSNFALFQLVPTAVPEPSSIALMGLAMAGWAFSRRRKS